MIKKQPLYQLCLWIIVVSMVVSCKAPAATPTPTKTASPQVEASPTLPKLIQDTTALSTPTPGALAEAFWSIQARIPVIAYAQNLSTAMEIFVVDYSKQPMKIYQLTDNQKWAFRPRWSPDTKAIAYLLIETQSGQVDFWVFDNPTGKSRPLTHNGVIGVIDYCWTGDGQYLVYDAPQVDGGEMDIYRINVDDGALKNLTEASPVWDSSPVCSPDGKWIAFVSDRFEGGKKLNNIWLMDTDGGELQNLTNSQTWENDRPAWSPDGKQIAFFRWGDRGDESESSPGLWIADVDGSGERQLLKIEDLFGALKMHPAWSPDGRFIALQKGTGADSDLVVVSVNAGETIQLTDMPGEDSLVSWSPDSKWLLFSHITDAETRLYVVPLFGGFPTPLFEQGGNLAGEFAPGLPETP